jgi:ribose transport system ATP-binding protein
VTGPTPILAVSGVSKTFVGRRVLSDFALELMAGDVRALLGQNGSGKSTFIKILAGYQPPDPGARISVRGAELEVPLRASDARQLGFAFVHQHLGLLPTESVLENFLIGDMRSGFGWRIPWRTERNRARRALAGFGIDVPLDVTVGSLPEVEQAVLAIIRAVEQLRDHDTGVLVLDEPTAYLPRDGIDRLFSVVREIAASGFAVLFVTHRLDEVVAIASHVSVLRDGALVADEPVAGLDEPALVERILGFSLDQLYPEANAAPRPERVLLVDGATGSTVHGASLDVGRGEIVGVTGLLGMGWEELPYLLFGAGTGSGSGSLSIGGFNESLATLTPGRAMRHGLALLPADRMRAGGIGDASVVENLTLPSLRTFFRRGILQRRREALEARDALAEYDVRPADPDRKLATLSGGNQQKVLLAKWFLTAPRAFLLHEPTHGIDVGAKKQIFARIRQAADDGAGVLIASAEYEDLAHICDRVLVFRDGQIACELADASLTTERILDRCFVSRSSIADPVAARNLEVTRG